MTTQTEAERLADQLEDPVNAKLYLAPYIAAELRRLVSFNQQLMDEVARLQKREWAGLTDEQPKRWAVFCGLCFKEWSVPYQHPGKSVCENCEAAYGITKGNT